MRYILELQKILTTGEVHGASVSLGWDATVCGSHGGPEHNNKNGLIYFVQLYIAI